MSQFDWRWQIKNSIKTLDGLKSVLPKSSKRDAWLGSHFAPLPLPFSVTPHFASLMGEDETCPIFLQVVATQKELVSDESDRRDPLGEEEREKVPHLVHRYPDRVLFLATDRCASYCRYCTRKRWVGQGPTPLKEDQQEAFDYIKRNPEIKEIIFSGGDPLLLSDERIYQLVSQSFAISHIDFVRFHTRMLSFAPMRITDALCEIFAKFSPLFLVTHFNHPQEISEITKEALEKLYKSGVVLLNQSVLLKGINDNEAVLLELFKTLSKNKVRPYYLHQCDVVNGASHFRVPIEEAIALSHSLRGKISGHCLPTFVLDTPGGHGKVPLTKSSIVREDDDNFYFEGSLGGISSYPKDVTKRA
jgi:lysine 2,3-aminomutase